MPLKCGCLREAAKKEIVQFTPLLTFKMASTGVHGFILVLHYVVYALHIATNDYFHYQLICRLFKSIKLFGQ